MARKTFNACACSATSCRTGVAKTRVGLTVECAADKRICENGFQISDTKMEALTIASDDFHPEWNYTISLRANANS